MLKIHLLLFDDGFEHKVEKASFDAKKIVDYRYNGNGDDGNGNELAGPYFDVSIDVEDMIDFLSAEANKDIKIVSEIKTIMREAERWSHEQLMSNALIAVGTLKDIRRVLNQ